MQSADFPTFILSRTDRLGDVILTLPMAAILKKRVPRARVIFLGRAYTRPLIEACSAVDAFLDWDELSRLDEKARIQTLRDLDAQAFIHVFPRREIAKAARAAKIPLRVGTSHRLWHWMTCNRLVFFSRKNSKLHEAELNFKLLKPWNIPLPLREEIAASYALTRVLPLSENLKSLLKPGKIHLIFHPSGLGSAPLWPIPHYAALGRLLSEEKYQMIITGDEKSRETLQPLLKNLPGALNLVGQTTLSELLSLVDASDGMVVASTGPAHLAAAMGKRVFALFSPRGALSPERWGPLGPRVTVFKASQSCSECGRGNCSCLGSISPETVFSAIEQAFKVRERPRS